MRQLAFGISINDHDPGRISHVGIYVCSLSIGTERDALNGIRICDIHHGTEGFTVNNIEAVSRGHVQVAAFWAWNREYRHRGEVQRRHDPFSGRVDSPDCIIDRAGDIGQLHAGKISTDLVLHDGNIRQSGMSAGVNIDMPRITTINPTARKKIKAMEKINKVLFLTLAIDTRRFDLS